MLHLTDEETEAQRGKIAPIQGSPEDKLMDISSTYIQFYRKALNWKCLMALPSKEVGLAHNFNYTHATTSFPVRFRVRGRMNQVEDHSHPLCPPHWETPKLTSLP